MLNIDLNSKLAQKIADRTMEILDYNINIRDKEGKIIASGDKNRLNDFSEMAAQGILNNKILKVSIEEAKNVKGMEPGVQIPINFNNNIIGAVDITGKPEEVENYVGLIKITVELLLQQSYYLKKIQLEEEAGENFVKDLIKKDFDEFNESMKNRAEVLGYDIEKRYLVCVLEVANFWDKILKKLGNTDTLGFQKHKRQIVREIESFFTSNFQIKVFHFEEEKFIILKSCEQSNCKNLFTGNCDQLIERLNNKFNFEYKMGVGRKAENLISIRQSYQDSLKSLKLGKVFHPNKDVFYYKNQFLERIVDNFKPEIRNNLAASLNLKSHYLKTLKVYFKTDMNITEAAKDLSLHRNSVVYRLNKISEITGLDPKKTEDIVQLQLALLSYEYENNLES